jgi:HEAT repeat protein
VPTSEAINQNLARLFDAERTVRRLHDDLAALEVNELLDALTPALSAALRERDENEATVRLVRLASLLGELDGPRVVDALIDVLTSDHAEARDAAGRELEALAYERFKEVAGGVERALKRLPEGSPALPELPYILAEVPEPGVVKLIGQFLTHRDPDAVAAAIETLAEIGDPKSIQMLKPLLGDARTADVPDDESDMPSEATLGELAAEAIELLEGREGDEEDT